MPHEIREEIKKKIFFLWEKDHPINEIIGEIGWSSNSVNIITRVIRERYKNLPYFRYSDRERARMFKKSDLERL